MGGRFFGLLPDSTLEGVGDFLLTAADRYAYTVSVPRMYNIVGRERVESLHSEKWQEAWEARRHQQVARAAQKKKKQAEKWEKAKQEFDSIGRIPFNGVLSYSTEKQGIRRMLETLCGQKCKAQSWL